MAKLLRGVVAWFDDIAGKGVIRGEDGEFYVVHYSTIHSVEKYKTLKKNQEVEFQIYQRADHAQVASIRVC